MDSETLKRAIVDTLKTLRKSKLNEFCHFLLLRKGVRRRTLSDPAEIADFLLSNFTEADAQSAAAEILKQIGCRDKADRLVLMAGGQLFNPDPWGEELSHSVDDVEVILDELLNKGVIQQESYDKIIALPTSEQKKRELLGHLKAIGRKDIFHDIIRRMQLPVLHGPSESLRDFTQLAGGFGGTPIVTKYAKRIVIIPDMSLDGDWIELEPEVNYVDSEDAPIYSLQSEAGNFECSVSGLRWVCKEKVSLKYQFGSWEEHMDKLETMQYVPGGPLLDITVIAGKLDKAYLPHWICTDNLDVLDKFAVLHIDTSGDVVEQVPRVTPSHVMLSQPIFSPRGVLMRAGFPVKIHCKVLIYKTNKAFLTLHVYLIPRDPALQQTIKNKELSSGYKMIQKPYPEKSLKMRACFSLTADMDGAEIYPEKLKLIYEGSDPNFFEVFIENPDRHIQLTLKHESGPVWTSAIRKDDYQNTGDIRVMYEEEFARARSKLVEKVSRELINQLLDDLLKDYVLNEGEKDWILQENNTTADRARCLIDTVKKKGREASRRIFTHLQSRDPTLSAQLGLPSGKGQGADWPSGKLGNFPVGRLTYH